MVLLNEFSKLCCETLSQALGSIDGFDLLRAWPPSVASELLSRGDNPAGCQNLVFSDGDDVRGVSPSSGIRAPGTRINPLAMSMGGVSSFFLICEEGGDDDNEEAEKKEHDDEDEHEAEDEDEDEDELDAAGAGTALP